MFRRIAQLRIKEFLQLKRDKSARFRLLIPPIIQMLLFGYAATFEVFNVSTAMLDQDHTPESRALIAAFVHSSRFEMTTVAQTHKEIENAVERSDAQVGVVVPSGFSERLRKGESRKKQKNRGGEEATNKLILLR